MAVSSNARQDNQPVFVLHTYPFKETSLVVELFTREFGRISAVAKGARRPRSAMRGMLQSFQPLLGAWSGKLELKTLHSLEWYAGLLMLQGEALMCGFYLNELLLRLLPREDSHEALFDERFLKGTGVTPLDFTKALIDEGFHPMTMYFPLVVSGALLIEPTECEGKASLDLFIGAMKHLSHLAKGGKKDHFEGAPHYTPRTRLDETRAARQHILRWVKGE